MTEARWLDKEEERAWRSLMAMQDGLSEFIDRQLRNRCGLSNADYQVLAHLSEAPDGRLRPFELGGLLRWEKSRLSQHLGRMENRGLVTRERCLTDQRGSVIVITARGSDLIEAAAPQHVADVRDALIDHLTAAELQTLTVIGDKVRERLAELEPASAPQKVEHAQHTTRAPGPGLPAKP
jgi:DNA-binding MarR family transcriptional regulator